MAEVVNVVVLLFSFFSSMCLCADPMSNLEWGDRKKAVVRLLFIFGVVAFVAVAGLYCREQSLWLFSQHSYMSEYWNTAANICSSVVYGGFVGIFVASVVSLGILMWEAYNDEEVLYFAKNFFRFIRAKKELRSLYEEYKTARINAAVYGKDGLKEYENDYEHQADQILQEAFDLREKSGMTEEVFQDIWHYGHEAYVSASLIRQGRNPWEIKKEEISL